jgi:hypothetical protein
VAATPSSLTILSSGRSRFPGLVPANLLGILRIDQRQKGSTVRNDSLFAAATLTRRKDWKTFPTYQKPPESVTGKESTIYQKTHPVRF